MGKLAVELFPSCIALISQSRADVKGRAVIAFDRVMVHGRAFAFEQVVGSMRHRLTDEQVVRRWTFVRFYDANNVELPTELHNPQH
ncbi:hypothetical protein GQ57_38590 [Burkholderia sp. MSh2]|nr:hypothetical protein GQ57_38590 [Burkholderia sp. MSh2]